MRVSDICRFEAAKVIREIETCYFYALNSSNVYVI